MGYAERPGPASDRMFRLCARYLALPIGSCLSSVTQWAEFRAGKCAATQNTPGARQHVGLSDATTNGRELYQGRVNGAQDEEQRFVSDTAVSER